VLLGNTTIPSQYPFFIFMIVCRMKNRKIERCNNKRYQVKHMNKKGLCKNCGEDINDDKNSNDFCSEQCGVEYQMEHNRK
jgi:hypothetical protein